MWTSIKHFEKPASLEEAYTLIVPGKKVPFSGGSYLTAEQSGEIDTLIAIRHLLDDRIKMNGKILTIGTGATLQSLVKYDWSRSPLRLAECACLSCPSRNIRNQRTLGGEIGRQRTNSELFVHLKALDVNLEVIGASSQTMSIREWDGQGIINALRIDMTAVKKTFCQRFALIPSAPAVVIVEGVLNKQRLDVVVGGAASVLSLSSITDMGFPEETLAQVAAQAAVRFKTDQYGSRAYKEHLIRTGLARIVAEC
ncbi:MAG: FAD binding domain-containing protein [Fidelibacterota bacterium]|nr:MAG: FAD binding domain-containing protein [Candidatus Neomarinimicrobiota bacterium]